MNGKPSKDYWPGLANELATKHPALAQEVRESTFEKWDPRSITYNRELAKKLIKIVKNQHEYAESTFLRKMKEALRQWEREQRCK